MQPTAFDFDTDVLAASHERPVLVDFWAPWCGPCRYLGPVLEKIAASDDRFSFVKVNTDEHPDLMQRFQIRGIPAVKLFYGGDVVGEFTGALPEHAITQWLNEKLPSPAKSLVAEARSYIEGGYLAEAAPLLEEALEAEPDHPEARMLLAQCVFFRDPEHALALSSSAGFAGAQGVQVAEAIQTLYGLMFGSDDLPEGVGKPLFEQVRDAVQREALHEAFEGILELLLRDRYYADDIARKTGVALFTLLGPQHDLSRTFRRRFDMYLY